MASADALRAFWESTGRIRVLSTGSYKGLNAQNWVLDDTITITWNPNGTGSY